MINKIYNNNQTVEKIREILDPGKSIQLQNILELESFKKLKLEKVKLKKEYKPELHSYCSKEYSNKELNEFLIKLLNKDIKSSELFIFRHRDYTLLNDNLNEKEGFKAILELTENWNNEANGYTSFIKDNKEIFRIIPITNSLTIIKTDKQMKSFIKYINNKAKNNNRHFLEVVL